MYFKFFSLSGLTLHGYQQGFSFFPKKVFSNPFPDDTKITVSYFFYSAYSNNKSTLMSYSSCKNIFESDINLSIASSINILLEKLLESLIVEKSLIINSICLILLSSKYKVICFAAI